MTVPDSETRIQAVIARPDAAQPEQTGPEQPRPDHTGPDHAGHVHAAEPADLVDLTGPIALLIGNEGNGIPSNLAAQADAAITIPCPGPVESLNAAVAASVLLYEAARQRCIRGAPIKHLGGPR